MEASAIYRPSGRVSWRIVPAVAAAAFVAFMLADLSFRLDKRGLRPPLLEVAAFSTIGFLTAVMLVILGRCRNVMLAAFLGGIFGAGWLLGFYQLSLVDARIRGSPDGLQGLSWRELATGLPDYLMLRMRNSQDVWRRILEDGEVVKQASPWAIGARGAVMALEFALAVAVGVCGGWLAARVPYSETADRWMTSKAYWLAAGEGRRFLEAVDEAESAPLAVAAQNRAESAIHSFAAPGDPTIVVTVTEKRGRGWKLLAKNRVLAGERRARAERLLGIAPVTSPT